MATPPSFVQLDPNALQTGAIAADRQGYNASDADYAKRFPDLVKARDNTIDTAASDLAGGQDPIFNSAFKQAGLGSVNLGNQFQTAKNLGKPILSQEQRNRTYFSDLFKENPERSFGLSSSDVAHISLANTGNKTAFDQAQFGANINQANADAQAAQNSAAALSKTIGGLASAGVNYFQNQNSNPSASSNYLDPNTYNYSPAGGYYNPGFGPSTTGGSYEGQIDGNSVYRATPVDASGGDGSSSGF